MKRKPLVTITPIGSTRMYNDSRSNIVPPGQNTLPTLQTVTEKTRSSTDDVTAHNQQGFEFVNVQDNQHSTRNIANSRDDENGTFHSENNAQIIGTPRSSHPTGTAQERQNNLSRSRCSLFPNRSMNEENDERPVHLGLDVYVDEDVWDYVLSRKKKTLFLRSAAELIWKPYHLMNRCFRPSKTTFQIPGRSPRKKIEKDKLNLLNRVYDTYLDLNQIKGSKRMRAKKKVKKILQRKIQDLRKIIDLVNKLHEENPDRRYLTTGLSSP